MPHDDLCWLPAVTLASLIRRRKVFPFNLTGQPAVSVPCGFTKDGLPIGLQIVGRRFDDATVLRAAAAFERVRPWAQHTPPMA